MKNGLDTKKIAFVIPNLLGGGAERNVTKLHDQFVKMGHDVCIILLANRRDYSLAANTKIYALSETGRIAPLKFLDKYIFSHRLKKLLKKLEQDGKKFDAIISNLLDADRIVARLRIKNCYYIICSNVAKNLSFLKGSWKKIRRRNRILRVYRNKNIIAISHGMAHDLIKTLKIKPKIITVIYNPFDFEKIEKLSLERNKDIPKEDYIIHVGRFSQRKRFDILLAAFAKTKTPCKLVMLIKPNSELKAMIRSFKLEHRVMLPGFQTNPMPWIKRAKLLVSSSESEGFCNVIVEALACGTPVVSTDCPFGPNEILTGELAHWLTPNLDIAKLSAKIDEALATDIKIPEKLLAKFDINKIAKQYIDLIGNR